ncbi:Golgi CORVET complex core vacuolar protein 8-domain-containing protein [Pyronema omphalodes]|nr:Golgi CORVET complex core vacuolar protein 8-domain-containing protein [Pyronema omphalodes]
MSSTPDENGAAVAPMPEPNDTTEVTEPTEDAKVNGDSSSPVDATEEPTEEAGSGGEGGGDEAAEEVAVETNGELTENPAGEAVTESIEIEQPTEEAVPETLGTEQPNGEAITETTGAEQPDEETITETIGTEQPAEVEAAKVPEEPLENNSSHLLSYLQEARNEQESEDKSGISTLGPTFKKFQPAASIEAPDATPDRPPSSVGSYSTPDDTPSLRGSVTSSAAGSAFGTRFSPSPSLRPFDRRFSSRLSPASPRAQSPSVLHFHSRTSSQGSVKPEDAPLEALEDKSAPWDVIRWTKLKTITSQLFSEAGKRSFGTPTCVCASATIAFGTSKGIILIFKYPQTLQFIIGPGTQAVECGPITALAVSADHTTIAGGHASGHIFTWEISKPSKPFLKIPPLMKYQMENRREDGHVEGTAVLHLGFLGTRHTALVSSDEKGMAFSHLATRGLGAVGRTVKTARILGRYPLALDSLERPRKPSTVLGMSVLPLGNSPEKTDTMGLVAMITPYLLVIVSTTPVAQTQHKAIRPKEVAGEADLSGCLAWYPAVKLKTANPESKPVSSKARLAYAWSTVLTLLELTVVEGEGPEDPNRPPSLEFHVKSRYRCDEAIVAVQWFSRQIIGILTVTRRLIILEDTALRVAETFDLMPKRILHLDVFGTQLKDLVNRVDEEGSHHPRIADAFFNSFRTYKGRIFLLCQHEVSVGTLSNWADRLFAMLEVGDFIGAITLATTYYIGKDNKLTIGLPEDPVIRHPMVEEKLLEMMSASLRYAFGKNQNSTRREALGKEQLQELAVACFDACVATNRTDFLFDEVFEYFEQGEAQGIFLETLEPHILDRLISFIPPVVVKALILHYTSRELESRLEEMICHMDTTTLDIDQVTTLCKQHALYDAMIYVWNRALGDYVTPMIDLLTLLLPLMSNSTENDNLDATNALKIFPYLSYTLTGRVYPTGEDLTEPESSSAKAQIYYFLFLGQTIAWPKGANPFLTKLGQEPEPSFPYLRLILQFDASSFLSALNEAFEDPFLNGTTEALLSKGNSNREPSEDQVFGRSVNRQYITSILLEVMNPTDFPPQDTVYLDMFIARNLPKFPQFVLLSGSALHRVLVGLCNPPGEDIADDCQLSVEYLLTVYRPPDIDALIALFTAARFFRVLKSIFRAEKQYPKLLRAYLEDPEAREAVFDCISECLRPRSPLSLKQRTDVEQVIQDAASQIISISPERSARIINSYCPLLHSHMLSAIEDKQEWQFTYLRTLLEPEAGSSAHSNATEIQKQPFIERYIRLICRFDPGHVNEFVSSLKSGDLRLAEVIPAMEESGAMDAAVVLLAREGQIRDAMDRLLGHLQTLAIAYSAALEAAAKAAMEAAAMTPISPSLPEFPSQEEMAEMGERGLDIGDGSSSTSRFQTAADALIPELQKYVNVGIWLCAGQSRLLKSTSVSSAATEQRRPRRRSSTPTSLTPEETLWLDLLNSISSMPITPPIRQLLQSIFSSLLSSISHRSSSFLTILRAFLSRIQETTTSLQDLRDVVGGVFEAYRYEELMLGLAMRMVGGDLWGEAEGLRKRRGRGWRPGQQACGVCGKKVWGHGAAIGAGVRKTNGASRKGKAVETGEGVVVFRCGCVYCRGCVTGEDGEVKGCGKCEGKKRVEEE